jgi:hypothetical protein
MDYRDAGLIAAFLVVLSILGTMLFLAVRIRRRSLKALQHMNAAVEHLEQFRLQFVIGGPRNVDEQSTLIERESPK